MSRWIWLALAGGIVALGAGAVAVYGSDENRLARACTGRSGTPLMSFTPNQPLFGWQFGRQTKVSADTPALADIEALADQNQVFWSDIFDEQDALQKEIGWTEPLTRPNADANGGALNRVNASLMETMRRLDVLMGTDSRFHVSEERFEKIRVSLPKTIEALKAVEALGPDKVSFSPSVKMTVSVTCYSAMNDGEPVATAFPTNWTIEPLACVDEKRCIPWEEFVGSAGAPTVPASAADAAAASS